MGKREWRNQVPEVARLARMIDMDDSTFALWALVERLEALVEIGDAMEEVADLWANTLAFGGQPVGGLGTGDAEPAPATRHAWMCDRSEGCVLMKGHGSECVFPGPNHCQCVKPDYDASDVCGKCGFVKGEIV